MSKDNVVADLAEEFQDHKLAITEGVIEMSRSLLAARSLGKSYFKKFCKEIRLPPDSSIILGLENIGMKHIFPD